jgi:predicted DNA-binding protein (MmcQ/YjbR family)
MNVDSVRGYCLSFPEARENLQWGEDLCFKVAGKIFAVLSLDSVPAALCFKCTPEKFGELCEQEGIRPAPYVGRYKWVLLERLDVLGDEELEDLIRQSYDLVVSKVSRQTGVKAGRVRVKTANHKGHKGHKGKSGSRQRG